MPISKPIREFLVVTAVMTFIVCPTAAGQPAGGAKPYEGLTRPSRDVDLVLRVSGVLADLPVASGSKVKMGDVVASLKSDIERQSLEISRLKSESNHEIDIAETSKKLKQTELDQITELASKEAASKWEVETTTVQVELEGVRAETARFNKRVAELEYGREKLLLAERTLNAPFDGVILRTLKEEGEGVAELEPIAVLVRLDPIWVECHLPTDRFADVRVGTNAAVRVADRRDSETPATYEGAVVAADPLIDPASSTFRIVIEVPNPDGLIVAGRLAEVSFPN